MRFRLDTKRMNQQAKAKTLALTIGNTYFLSSFYDQDGCWVRVIEATTDRNAAGWNSSVEVEVLEPVGDDRTKAWYQPGRRHSVNACNLYKQRTFASHRAKYGRLPRLPRLCGESK